MKAQLELENIGCFKGTKRFGFQRGVLSEVEAPNAKGKTTLARALARALIGSLTHDETIREARNQGVLRESLKNIYEKDARVGLQYDNRTEEWRIGSDGSVTQLPLHGDERFIWAGMLTQEARSIRQLIEGNPDFSWVPRFLSYADRYLVAKETVEAQISDAESKISVILKRLQGLTEQNKRLQEWQDKKSELDRKRDQLAQHLDEKKRQHIERMKDLDRQLDSERRSLVEFQASIEKSESEIKRLASRLESNARNATEIEREMGKIDLEAIRKEVIESVSRIDGKIADFRSQLSGLKGKKSTFADAKSVLIQRGVREGVCPVCGISTISTKSLEDKISELEIEINKIERSILSLSAERTHWLQKEATKRQELDKYGEIKLELANEKRDLTSRKFREEKTLKDLEKRLKELKEAQLTIIDEKTRLEKETEKWERETHEALKQIEVSLKKMNDTIAEEMRKIQEDSFFEVHDKRASLEQAKEWLNKYKSRLAEIREYLDQRQHDHEIQAVATFNKNVKRVMADLMFTEFDQIALDKDDKLLKVIRPGFVRQSIESLSTSEKYSIAVVLQIALKETYLQDIPFFIVDEIVVSYDSERKEKILDYLNRLAKEKGLYVIVTKLAEKATGEVQVKAR